MEGTVWVAAVRSWYRDSYRAQLDALPDSVALRRRVASPNTDEYVLGFAADRRHDPEGLSAPDRRSGGASYDGGVRSRSSRHVFDSEGFDP